MKSKAKHSSFTLLLVWISLLSTTAYGATPPTMEDFFNWAETTYPGVFPHGPSTKIVDPYRLRQYENGNYLGVANGRVYIVGPVTDNQLLDVGLVTNFSCLISPTQSTCNKTNTKRTLTDTGVNICLSLNIGFVDCTAVEAIPKQDGATGLDVSSRNDLDGRLGFSYSKVNDRDPTECIQDNITGLMWEGKTNDGENRDGMLTYQNIGDGRPMDAASYVHMVNSSRLCGFSDWRLPTVGELGSLVDYSVSTRSGQPSIDHIWFPNTRAQWYLTSTPYNGYASGFPSGRTWVVSFYNGNIFLGFNANSYNVRLVRSPNNWMPGPYNYSGDGSEVTDASTGLTWKRCVEGMTWNGKMCHGLPTLMTSKSAMQIAASSIGWRLPNIKELSSTVAHDKFSPAIDQSVFPNTPATVTWSSTVPLKVIDFGDGSLLGADSDVPGAVRLVR